QVDNTATATGTPPSGPPVEDDGSTTVTLDSRSVLGLAKALVGVTNNGDDTTRVALLLTVENLGATSLTDLVVTDDVLGQFAGMDPRDFEATDGSLTANTAWDGAATTDVLTGGQGLDPGETGTVFIAFTVTPGDETSRTNTAESEAVDPFDTPVEDTSTDGTDPDPNGDGNPDEDEPTVVPFEEHPQIGASKRVAAGPVSVGGGGQAVTYEIVVANVGDVGLNQVQAIEDLAATFAGVQSFTVDQLTSPSLTVNSSYDGTGDTDLLTGTDTLAVGQSGTIALRVLVVPGSNLGPFENQVEVSGTSPAGVTVTDRSTDGGDIDPDGDGNPGNDSTPTSVSFGTSVTPTPLPATPSRPNAPLPATGQDSATAAQLAAALMAVGAVLLVAGRKRRDEVLDAER
ncbi:MAG: LPXTG cell wall anchor domain-containing protein, partial [Acidimicrobiales bacterium]